MAKPNVTANDTFEEWRGKTNDISDNVGDPDSLNTANKTSLVDAVNEINNATADRGGLTKNSDGELLVDIDDSSINVSNNNKLQIKNDGVHKQHLNENVAGPGLQQLKNEELAVDPNEGEGITLTDDQVAIKDYGVTPKKLKKQNQGSIITYTTNGEPIILAPGTAGQVLTANGTGADISWGGGGSGNLLAYSGYLTVGEIVGKETTTVTVKSTKALTNPVNLLSAPGGLRDDGTTWRNLVTQFDGDSNYGFVWSSNEGLVVVRAARYYELNVGDGDDHATEQILWGIRVFNVGTDTFISFKIKNTSGGDIDSGQGSSITQWFLMAELIPGASAPTIEYYTNTGAATVDAWAIHTSYATGAIVTSDSKLYEKINAGTQNSGDTNTQPTHRFFDAGTNKRGEKKYNAITWRFLGDI